MYNVCQTKLFCHPLHWCAKRLKSNAWTSTTHGKDSVQIRKILNADSRSTLAINTIDWADLTKDITCRIVASGGILSYTDDPSGYDRLCVIQNSPYNFLDTTPSGDTLKAESLGKGLSRRLECRLRGCAGIVLPGPLSWLLKFDRIE